MKTLKIFVLSTFCLFLFQIKSNAQVIEPPKGYSQDIGNMVAMLDDIKGRIHRLTMNMSQDQVDFLLDEKANRIGAMVMHLAATEAFYQVYTFEGREFNEEETAKWMTALELGETARAEFQGKPIAYYFGIWDEVREKTKALLKEKDDKWFSSKLKGTQANNHWAWFHVMEHQSNHMGQIALLRSRLPQ
ncbi:mycothiol transferase [Algoriphagus pacificus]|uniref:DUF664 domain-containing protein n=1 Tax=Algoriphagus pacificus TaxID=2811234 RepID=A0ABS3CLP0_9BACT|nr:DUF664 domain-containing protein [Algoriphagus pacificus]MBN7817096.1 DUF664 domain-containing protein [Algoriphagus pacificus]